MINSIKLDSLAPWKRLLIIWSIHWDERAWSLWIERFLLAIRSWQEKLVWGSIVCIPYANWEAWNNNVRYIDHNANRLFNQAWDTPEHILTWEIKRYIKESDFILDLHTYHFGKWSFLFDDMETREGDDILQVVPVDQILLWWNNLYTNTESWMDTTAYGKSLWISWTTVECWSHWDINAVDIAYESIISVWTILGILDWVTTQSKKIKRRIRMEKIVWKEPGAEFVKEWEHWDIIKPNEEIYRLWEDTIRNWNTEKVMIIPFHEANEKDEWFYVGKEVWIKN